MLWLYQQNITRVKDVKILWERLQPFCKRICQSSVLYFQLAVRPLHDMHFLKNIVKVRVIFIKTLC